MGRSSIRPCLFTVSDTVKGQKCYLYLSALGWTDKVIALAVAFFVRAESKTIFPLLSEREYFTFTNIELFFYQLTSVENVKIVTVTCYLFTNYIYLTKIGNKYWRCVKMSSLATLPDLLLIESYHKAIDIELEPNFIDLLLSEINRRGLKISEEREMVLV